MFKYLFLIFVFIVLCTRSVKSSVFPIDGSATQLKDIDVKIETELLSDLQEELNQILDLLLNDRELTDEGNENPTEIISTNSVNEEGKANETRLSPEREPPSTPVAARARAKRQQPPTTLFRRKPPARPCRGDGTSAVFSGSNAMSYISFLANVMALVLNINNNVNNNNNNNNINSNNNIDNNNANLNINSNNANQVNIMPPGGRRRRHLPPWALVAMSPGTRAVCAAHDTTMERVLEATVEASWSNLTKNRKK
ncbi:serum factor response D-like [Penaeus indicus]|uniref:serum factor response D-like n=1 Tax=Penaeus indicus TaxID=29960 RepID=UPI00300CEB42